MAVSYVLESSSADIVGVKDVLRALIAAPATAEEHGWIRGRGLVVRAALHKECDPPGPIAEEYGFRPQLGAVFELADEADRASTVIALGNMVEAVQSILDADPAATAVLHGSAHGTVLRRLPGGALELNSDWEYWTADDLTGRLHPPYELRPLRSLSL
jgi:hypothetical protein